MFHQLEDHDRPPRIYAHSYLCSPRSESDYSVYIGTDSYGFLSNPRLPFDVIQSPA